MLTHRSVVFACLVLTGACGDDGALDAGGDSTLRDTGASSDTGAPSDTGTGDAAAADADAGAPPPVEADALPALLAAAYCEAQRPCCELDSVVASNCETAVAADVERMLMRGDGMTMYDAAEAGRCVAALQALPADCALALMDTDGYRRACSFTINGTVPPGEACGSPEHCERMDGALGSTETGFVGCAPYGGSTDPLCRAFVPTMMVGAMCEVGFDGSDPVVNICAGGELYCDAGTCQLAPAVGEPCPGSVCVAGAYCPDPTGDCVARATEGMSCTSTPCDRRLDCIMDMCTGPTSTRLPVFCLGQGCVSEALACAAAS